MINDSNCICVVPKYYVKRQELQLTFRKELKLELEPELELEFANARRV